MNNRKVALKVVGTQTERWNPDNDIAHVQSREVNYLLPIEGDNPMYNYWRAQKMPWTENRVSLFTMGAEVIAKSNMK